VATAPTPQPYGIQREVEDLAALIAHAGGSAFVDGMSSGCPLALHAAAEGLVIAKLALFEPPIQGNETPTGESDFTRELAVLVTAGRRREAVERHAVVGYLAGCRNTAAMRPSTEELTKTVIRRYWLLFRPGTAGFLYRGLLDSLRDRERASGDFIDPRWPAHLHIDLLPSARGTGLGAALMERWLQQLQEAGSPGCHLLTLVENTRALKFFEKSGFRNHGNPTLVGGMRGKLVASPRRPSCLPGS